MCEAERCFLLCLRKKVFFAQLLFILPTLFFFSWEIWGNWKECELRRTALKVTNMCPKEDCLEKTNLAIISLLVRVLSLHLPQLLNSSLERNMLPDTQLGTSLMKFQVKKTTENQRVIQSLMWLTICDVREECLHTPCLCTAASHNCQHSA